MRDNIKTNRFLVYMKNNLMIIFLLISIFIGLLLPVENVHALASETAQSAELTPDNWKEWPVIPLQISDTMKTLYQIGIASGNNPKAFSKVGDSNSVLPYFFSCFDYRDDSYALGNYSNFQDTIDNFYGSFSRDSRAVKLGITAYELDNYHWYDDEICWPYESATRCEYRLNMPSIAFIALGSNDVMMDDINLFETHMRSLVEKTLSNRIVPILVTKVDNLEGDDSYNRLIAQIAYDNQLPLWNLWRAAQDLPSHGLRDDNVHMTYGETLCDFSGDDVLNYGWTVRNLGALQMLDLVWKAVR